MSKGLKRILKITLPLAVGVFLIWYSYQNTTEEDRNNIVTYIKEANYWWVALSLFFGVLSHFSRAYRWNFMLEPLGYKPKFPNNLMTVLIAYFANLGVPRSGEVFRATAISAYEDIPFEKAFGTIVAERIADLVMLLTIILLAFILQTDTIFAYFAEKEISPVNMIIGVAALGVGFFIFTRFIKNSTNPFAQKVKKFVVGLYEGVMSIAKMKKKGAFIFHTIFIWVMYILMFYVIKFTVPETIDLPLGVILVGFVAGAFTMSTTNGGIGFYPIAITKVFLAFGISEASGLAFGWIMWTAQTVMVVIFGALAFLFLPIYNRKK